MAKVNSSFYLVAFVFIFKKAVRVILINDIIISLYYCIVVLNK